MPAPVLVIAPPDAPALADFSEEDPHDLIEEAEAPHTPAPEAADVPVRRGSRRLRHAAILAAGRVCARSGGPCRKRVGAAARRSSRNPLQLPPLPPPPKQHLRSGAAPVIPPADFLRVRHSVTYTPSAGLKPGTTYGVTRSITRPSKPGTTIGLTPGTIRSADLQVGPI